MIVEASLIDETIKNSASPIKRRFRRTVSTDPLVGCSPVKKRWRANFPRIFRQLSPDVIDIDRVTKEKEEKKEEKIRGGGGTCVGHGTANVEWNEQLGWKFPSDEIRHLHYIYRRFHR